MHPRRVIYSPQAQTDLLEIFDYISKDSPDAAEIFIEEIDSRLSRLSRFPQSGAIPKDGRLQALGYRIVVTGDYLAFYIPAGKMVQIKRIIHGKRRYSFLL